MSSFWRGSRTKEFKCTEEYLHKTRREENMYLAAGKAWRGEKERQTTNTKHLLGK